MVKDPVGEKSFFALLTRRLPPADRQNWVTEREKPEYVFTKNMPPNGHDYLGLATMDPCSLGGMAGKDDAGVVCVNGVATRCVWDQNWKSKPSEAVRACAMLHEQTHIDSPYHVPCPKCVVQRGTTTDKDKDECEAYKVTRKCLDDLLKGGLKDEDTDSWIELSTLTNERLKKHCKTVVK